MFFSCISLMVFFHYFENANFIIEFRDITISTFESIVAEKSDPEF
jgi:hypothetical protein